MNPEKTPILVWLVPIGLVLAALFPWPVYGYYIFLRIVMCIACAFLAYRQFVSNDRLDFWTILLGAVAVLYNPIIPVHLTREIWSVINVGTAAVLGAHWALVGRNWNQ